MKKQSTILAGIIIGAMLFGGCTNQAAAVDSGNADTNPPAVETSQQPNVPAIKATVTEKKIEEQTDALKTTISYPILSGLADTAIQDQLNSMFEKAAMDFKAEIETAANQDYAQSKTNTDMTFRQYEVFVSYTVHTNKDHLLSITSDYYQYTGGAHGGTNRIGYNIDLRTGKRLQLPDLFESGFDYKAALIKEVTDLMNQGDDIYFDDAVKVINEMADNRPFYFENGNLVLYFGQYEIAPYAAGMPEFKIPLEKLQLKSDLGL